MPTDNTAGRGSVAESAAVRSLPEHALDPTQTDEPRWAGSSAAEQGLSSLSACALWHPGGTASETAIGIASNASRTVAAASALIGFAISVFPTVG